MNRSPDPAAPENPACPACKNPGLRTRPVSPRLDILNCDHCHHRVARHRVGPSAPEDQDIHAQYEQGEFLQALQTTRERQARAGLQLLMREKGLGPKPDQLLDYGSGRGWFIEAAQHAGYRQVAGADISELALDWLRKRGAEAVPLTLGAVNPGAAFAKLPFRPRVLSFLDVVEHFTPQELEPVLRSLTEALRPELARMLIKVPTSEGLLYRVASGLARLGMPGPLERLYQVGSLTPHHHYFSRNSARALFARLGWRLCAVEGDPDFEPESLLTRARLLTGLPLFLKLAIGHFTTAGIRALGWADTHFFLVDPRRGE